MLQIAAAIILESIDNIFYQINQIKVSDSTEKESPANRLDRWNPSTT